MGNYDEILHLPHHVSKKHKQMSLLDRAAQFSPFAALTGFDDQVQETARITDLQILPDENLADILDQKLQVISQHLPEHPIVSFTYFLPDDRKAGGAYRTASGIVKKIDSVSHCVVLTDGNEIPIDRILDISCSLFTAY